MRIVLNAAQWKELNVDNEELFVRAAFYLCFSYMHIQARCREPAHEDERLATIDTALELGMTEKDVIIKGTPRNVTRM